jgi:hypothetical protein
MRGRPFSYHERGTLTDKNGHHFEAEQRYIFALTQNAKPEEEELKAPSPSFFLYILFADTPLRAFHRLSPIASPSTPFVFKADSVHICGSDRYESHYFFEADTAGNARSFTITHTVTGPRKDYVSHTVYHK